jgi:hypothetical protein
MQTLPSAASCIFCTNERDGAMGKVQSGVQTPYYGLGIVFMLGGAGPAYVKNLQGRIGKQEKQLGDYKLYVAERCASTEFSRESEAEILDSIRDLARRITVLVGKTYGRSGPLVRTVIERPTGQRRPRRKMLTRNGTN